MDSDLKLVLQKMHNVLKYITETVHLQQKLIMAIKDDPGIGIHTKEMLQYEICKANQALQEDAYCQSKEESYDTATQIQEKETQTYFRFMDN